MIKPNSEAEPTSPRPMRPTDDSARASTFDYLDEGLGEYIHDTLASFRQHCPVFRSEAHGGHWVVTTHAAITEAAQASERFSAAVDGPGAVSLLPELDSARAPVFETDDEAHTYWRRLIKDFFTPSAAQRHEPYIRSVTRNLLDELRPLGRADLISDFAAKVPPLVIGAVLGVPEADRPALASLTRALTDATAAPELAAELVQFLQNHIRACSQMDSNANLLAAVSHGRPNRRPVSPAELLKFSLLMVAAGHLTTTDTIANTVLAVAENPALRQQLHADPARVTSVVNESIRTESAVAATGRTVRVDTTLAGVRLPQGAKVLLLWGSGNRDSGRFPMADDFDVDRRGGHLGWGIGPHACAGRHLARLELEVVLGELFGPRGLPNLQLASRPRRTYGVLRGVKSPLTIRW